jgi:enoyl-CoA hydratase
MAATPVRYELDGDVAVVTMDDGKANALSFEMLAALNEAFTRAEAEARATLLLGRPGRFCAGFNLKTMTSGAEAGQRLVTEGAELILRMYTFPRPVFVACSGHALAAGAILLLAADRRIGARGDFKIGLNEVAIQMTLPTFGVEISRDRLSRRHFTAAVTQARIYDPTDALDAGFLDALATADDLNATALEEARRLAQLPSPAFANTKLKERGATVRLIRETLETDIAGTFGVS